MSEMVTKESVTRLVAKGLPRFDREPKKDANLHLKEAAEKGEDWLVKLLLEGDSSLINDSAPAWQIACVRGHFSTLLAFIEQCDQQEFIKFCQKNKQTPLHHINLLQYEQYRILLANPMMQELNNQLDSGDATPLHRAIERNDFGLTKALLETEGIKVDIEDQNHKTVLDLLEEKYITNGNFFELYKELLANPLMTLELKNKVDNNGATSLHRAIERNYVELTKALLETKGIQLDIEDLNHKTALDLLEARCITSNNFFKIYKELLASPVMTQELKNKVDNNGATSLHRAIVKNVQRQVKALIETKGVKIEIKDNDGKSALDLIEERCSIKSEDRYWYELYKTLLANPESFQKMNRRSSSGATPLHIAIEWDDLELAKTLLHSKGIKLNFKNTSGKTALDLIEERCDHFDGWYDLYEDLLANTLMTEELKNRIGVDGATSLHRAIAQNAKKLAKTLMGVKGMDYEIKDKNGKMVVDLIEERCSIKSVDGYWYELYKTLLANPERFQKMKNRRSSSGATPLHIAIEWDDLVLAKTLLQSKGIKLNLKDTSGKTALDLIEERCDPSDGSWYDLYEDLLLANTLMTKELKNRIGINGTTSLHRAIAQNAQKLAKLLMGVKGMDYEIKDNNGKTVVDLIEERCKRKIDDNFWFKRYKDLLANPDMLQKLKNHRGSSGATPLHIAVEWGNLKLAKTLVHTKGIELAITDTNGKTALDLIEERCEQHDSPWYQLYKELLDNPSYVHELKNRQIGSDKETPLHRAIKWDDVKLAKTLLETKGVKLSIKNRHGKTALDLLEGRYRSGKWAEMCREIRLDPSLKIFKFKYLQRRTSLNEMQNTLSVVAALLATITFAAGFTVPGGVDSNTGTATLGKNAAFLVFAISNTLAMCSSMVVLFTVIGAMIWESHPNATPLIDFCVSLLQLSLCGTIVAFMTGVYSIMAPKVEWAAIVVIALCSFAFAVALIVVSSFWPLLHKPYQLLKTLVCKLVSHQKFIFCCRTGTQDSSSLGAP